MGGKGGAACRKLQAKDNSDKLSCTLQDAAC